MAHQATHNLWGPRGRGSLPVCTLNLRNGEGIHDGPSHGAYGYSRQTLSVREAPRDEPLFLAHHKPTEDIAVWNLSSSKGTILVDWEIILVWAEIPFALATLQGSRGLPGLSAATLASLGGTSSRRGSGDTSISIDTEASIREIKVRPSTYAWPRETFCENQSSSKVGFKLWSSSSFFSVWSPLPPIKLGVLVTVGPGPVLVPQGAAPDFPAPVGPAHLRWDPSAPRAHLGETPHHAALRCPATSVHRAEVDIPAQHWKVLDTDHSLPPTVPPCPSRIPALCLQRALPFPLSYA